MKLGVECHLRCWSWNFHLDRVASGTDHGRRSSCLSEVRGHGVDLSLRHRQHLADLLRASILTVVDMSWVRDLPEDALELIAARIVKAQRNREGHHLVGR